MRTTGEILDDAESGGEPTRDECYWVMLVLARLSSFDATDRLYEGGNHSGLGKKMRREEAFHRRKRAYAADPKKWIGPENDPSHPEAQKRRQVSFAILKKVMPDHEK